MQPLGVLKGGVFAHTPDEQVGFGVHKNGFAQGVCPKVIVGHPAQAGLYAAKGQGQAGKSPAGQVGIDKAGPVGSRPGFAAGGIGIVMPFFAKGCVMGQQRIQRACADAGEKARPAHNQQVIGLVPAGLGHNARAKAVVDEPAGQQHTAERWVVHIGIAGDEEHVQAVPAERVHFFCAHGDKRRLLVRAVRA